MPSDFFWPVVVSLLILAIAYLIFYVMKNILDFGSYFLYVIAGFLILYILAAIYVSKRLPRVAPVGEPVVVTQSVTPSSWRPSSPVL